MFERLYDQLMSDVDYQKLYQQIQPYINVEDTIIDAGCGSGYFLIELLKHHHQVIGIDVSSSMLSLAQQHLFDEGLSASLYEHDLRQPMTIQVDVICAMFDVMNYFKGVMRVFKHIKDALLPGGRFIFDIYKEEVLKDYQGYHEKEIDPLSYTWEIKTKNHVMTHYVNYDHQTDIIRQYVYPITYYQSILFDLGFDIVIHPSIDPRKHLIVATLR